jgi:tetratricopeptide (TPR) repeat protein
VIRRHQEFTAAADLVRAAHRQLGGTAVLNADMTADGESRVDVRRDFGDAFAQFIREGELFEYRAADMESAIEAYQKARDHRPDDPIAKIALRHAAEVAGERDILMDLTKAELADAQSAGDIAGQSRAHLRLATLAGEDARAAMAHAKAAAAVEPGLSPGLRAYERRVNATAEGSDRFHVLGLIAEAIGEGSDQVPLAMERARAAIAGGATSEDALNEYRRAYELDPRQRQALLALESAAQGEGSSLERAELELAVADYFANEPETRAAFLCRAAETFEGMGEYDVAIEHYRSAVALIESHQSALLGWRYAALASQRWREAAEACKMSAEGAESIEAQVALKHLTGVILMDRALDNQGAIEMLREVLALAVDHRDAFARLRLLHDEEGNHEALVELLQDRINVAEDAERIELHMASADLLRTFFEDREQATEHLRSILDIDPDHRAATSALADITWEQGDWAEAAQALVSWARIESEPSVLKQIFFRLGTIYAERMPDTDLAIKSFEKVLVYDENDEGALDQLSQIGMKTEDWRMALGACERLITTCKRPASKVRYLHRAAQIYIEGFEDRPKAEQAYRIAIDVDPSNDEALDKILEFFYSDGDRQSMRVHLDRVAAAMRTRLNKQPLDGPAYRVLARTLAAREEAGVAGSAAVAQCAAEIAVLLGASDDKTDELANAAKRARPNVAKLGTNKVDDILYPRVVSSALRQLFGTLGERIAKHVGIDLRRYGVGRGDRLGKNDPTMAVIREIAREMDIGDVEVYVSTEHRNIANVEPTSPISIILGTDLINPDRPSELRFLAGRCLKLMSSGLAIAARMPAREFGVLTAALVRHFLPDFKAKGIDVNAIATEFARQKRLVPANRQQELAAYAAGLATFDFQRAWAGIAEASNRAGLLASGSATAAVSVLLKAGGYTDIHQASNDVALSKLLRFAVSEDHAALRATMARK